MPIIFNKKKRLSQEQIRVENLDVIYNRAALNDIQISAAQTLHSSFTPVRLHMSEITELLQALVSGDRQNNRLIRLSFPRNDAPSGALMVANRLDASEGLSRDFRYTVEVLSDDPRIPLKDVLGKMVTLELNHDDGSVRYFNGYVFDFRFARNDGGFSIYGMVLLPWMAFLRYRRNNKLFHGMSVEQQTSEIFAQHASSDWKITHLSGDSVMTDACQFDESDYNYLHRRWEDLGWHYHFEHRADGHTLVLSADSTAAHPIDGTGEVQWVSDSGVVERGLKTLSPVRTVASTHYSTSSFDFKKPRPAIADVPTRNEQGLIPELEVYEYAGAYGFKDADDGRDFVTRRMEEIEAAAKHFEASGDAESVLPGRSFKLVGHVSQYLQAAEEAKNEFLVVDVQHSASNNYELQQGATSEYRLSLHCLRKSIPWRPGRGFNSVEPRIYGLQTAIVVGPQGEEIHTDEFGRVRVQFHWDRLGEYDEKSSAWVRVASTWAGSRFGFMAVPRIGQEVLVQFLDGNPDRPLITARLYNADNMPPWDLPANKTQTGILSRSSQGGGYDNANAIRFEDKKGAEEVWIHAEKDQRIEVENCESHSVGVDRSKTIGNNETVSVGVNRTETVGTDESITIGNNRSENVGANETIAIGANRTESVGKNEAVSIGISRTKSVGKNERDSIGRSWSVNVGKFKTESIGMAYMQNVGLGRMENVGAAYNLNVGGLMATVVGAQRSDNTAMNHSVGVGKSFTLKAGEVIELRCGQSVLRMDASGKVTIQGTEFLFDASGPVQINGKDIDLN